MPGHGIKISLPGYDVQTCAPVECSLHSDYTAFKSRTIGAINIPANTWTSVNHAYGYAPAYSLWYTGEACGLSGIKISGCVTTPYNDGMLESYITTSDLYLRSTKACTVYYYLYADDAGTISSHVPIPNYGEFGLMISRQGVDVTKAKPYELNFLSTYPNFKVRSTKAWSGGAIERFHVDNPDIGDSGNINWNGASNYGERGLAVISGYILVSGDDWHWIEQGTTTSPIINDGIVNQYGIEIRVIKYQASGGDTQILTAWFNGDGADRKFYYDEGGTQEISEANGWNQATDGNWYKSTSGWIYTLACTSRIGEENIPENFIPSVWWNTGGAQSREYIEEIFAFTGTTDNQFTSVSRGQHGTNAQDWLSATNVTITPIASVYEVATTDTNYNPCYFAWTINAFEADGGMGLPYDDGNNSLETICAGGKIYLVSRRKFYSEEDDWRAGELPYILPGVFVKIMHDEIGT